MKMLIGGSKDKHYCDYCKMHARDLHDLVIGDTTITLCNECLSELYALLKLQFGDLREEE